ncbi:MAG: SurA N-terminal domain-containing protein [Nitrospiraceae bacterium]|nr:MAG: SurA N-terminal domain-containing protein [Nitrospiraceae bacterium]
MLKIMRSHKFFTVFMLSAITIMISVAFIFWGIGPKDNPTISYVARIGDERISLDQYWRAYDNEYKRLREQNTSPEDIEKLNLEDRVLAGMVNRTVLRIAAEKAGIVVTEEELQEAIMSTPYFQSDGVFNQGVYERALKLNRTTPQAFEAGVREDLLVRKMNNIIAETWELSPDEQNILESMKTEDQDQLRRIFQSSKIGQTVQAYIESMKRKLDIEINRDLIS